MTIAVLVPQNSAILMLILARNATKNIHFLKLRSLNLWKNVVLAAEKIFHCLHKMQQIL